MLTLHAVAVAIFAASTLAFTWRTCALYSGFFALVTGVVLHVTFASPGGPGGGGMLGSIVAAAAVERDHIAALRAEAYGAAVEAYAAGRTPRGEEGRAATKAAAAAALGAAATSVECECPLGASVWGMPLDAYSLFAARAAAGAILVAGSAVAAARW